MKPEDYFLLSDFLCSIVLKDEKSKKKIINFFDNPFYYIFFSAYLLSNILLLISQTLQVSSEVKLSLQNYKSNNQSNFQRYDEYITFIKSKTLEEAEDFGLQAMNSLFEIEEKKIFDQGTDISV